ncbi:MAG: hypothetical protein AB7E32_17355 [Desulfovibrio sp.]
MEFTRTIDELQARAVLWWPDSLKRKDSLASVLPLLLETQEEFLRILELGGKEPLQCLDLLKAAQFPVKLFLKHLVILSNFGGEPIQRLGREFVAIFPKDAQDRHYMRYSWKGKPYEHTFLGLPVRGLSNKKLGIDGEALALDQPMSLMIRDMVAILLFGAASEQANQAGLEACAVGDMLGDADALRTFVQQRYIVVSRIMGGATANSLGQLAQTELTEFLQHRLSSDFIVERNGSIVLNGYAQAGGMPFDVVIRKGENQVGVEVSFQVTTNSTIERKAGQSADRQRLMHANGYGIGYVIDGAGNFQRSSAISNICANSDCTVAYSEQEFEVLAQWIESRI